jgi:hypothetical protein
MSDNSNELRMKHGLNTERTELRTRPDFWATDGADFTDFETDMKDGMIIHCSRFKQSLQTLSYPHL